ncbi:OLC1v1014504C1 [Oldenlandia corymbosa var. corymbosa]|uniref:OLC1v1014504C1 n=1 Tax=Oldenlandia corymbosa var. corymbosa TaxID=529605 RepID=A0AAV1E2Z3_OLDCO|nr:OLC1v1014504C1 [Oldenlandia corymbosa var. corymbosa]
MLENASPFRTSQVSYFDSFLQILVAAMASLLTLFGLFLSLSLLISFEVSNVDAQIGVCYGLIGNNLPSKQDTVNLYRQNGIGKMRIYGPDSEVLNALQGSNIELVMGVADQDIQRLASDPSEAANWVRTNIQAYSSDVNFKYIAVGNEIIPSSGNAQYVGPAMENLHNAISGAGLGDKIKVTTATFMGLIGASFPPSRGSFRDDAKQFIKPVIDILVRNNAPLLINIYPYFSYIGDPNNIQLDYALFRSGGTVVQDGSNGYQNLFDAMLDACYSALENEGGSNVQIVVSESGWPSDGNPPAASVVNAETYVRNLISHVKSGAGTPKRPGRAIETYIFAMFDENGKQGAETEKHFGLFSPTQQSKYSVSF